MELKRTKKPQQRSLSPSHSSLMLACQQEAREDVKAILHRQPGAALQRDRTGKNALHYCAENSNVDCANLILSSAPSVLNSADDEGYSPLHLAVISGNKSMVKHLLDKGADSAAVDKEKHSCVHWATVSGDCECIELLINAGANASTPDIHGAYPVHYAAQMCGPNSEMGNNVRVGLAVLQKLLSREVDVTVVDRDGRPPLLWAASGETRASKTYCPSGSSDAILALVKSGADVNAVDRDGLTALHCAASRGHVDCLETLITLCGAEVDKADDNGCSALFYAVTLGHADCTNLLLTFGSDGNRQDHKNRTPAHCGAAKGQLETLKILLHHKANLWVRNAKGDMPLHEAVQSGRKDLVEWLLQQHQGSVNVSNANGRTPLHIAAITNNVDMCKVLMDYGAFVNPIMRNSKGQQLTPLDAALHRGNRSCAKYLNLHGALPGSKLLEKREYNRFTETHLSETLELSPNTKRRLLRDTSAQTESDRRDVDIQAHLDQNTPSNLTNRSNIPVKTGSSYHSFERTAKPIIAKVYLHTKRSRIRRVSRKATAYKRDCQGEKASTREQPQQTSVQLKNRASSHQRNSSLHTGDSRTEFPSRKVSQPLSLEDSNLETADSVIHTERIPDSPKLANVIQVSEEQEKITSLSDLQEVLRAQTEEDESLQKQCNCHSNHPDGTDTCDCNCHSNENQLLTVDENKRQSSLRTNNLDSENHSPLSSIRSLESTIKDSGFSDDHDREHHMSSSDDEQSQVSDSNKKSGRRKRKHIARYIVSSGAAETFRLDEEDEEEKNTAIRRLRSSSLPHLKKKDNSFDACPRLLNRPTVTKEIQRSLKKYQMERRLFYELQELKRRQITTPSLEEKEAVQKMLDRFRNHVQSPFMTDFQGPLSFRAFEKYLYEQLRKLSMGGKIPKLKGQKDILERIYVAPSKKGVYGSNKALCLCRTHNCHHKTQSQEYDSALENSSSVLSLPEIVPKTAEDIKQALKTTVNRSKSWDQLDDNPKKNATFLPTPGKLGQTQNSKSLPSLSSPFPRRVPAALLAAINERLSSDVHPDDTIVIEMSAEDISSKMRHAFTVQEIREVVSRYEAQVGRKVKPIPLETVLDPEDDGPITFEIRHGKERNVFKLPAGKLKNNKKWQVTFTIGKRINNLKSLQAK